MSYIAIHLLLVKFRVIMETVSLSFDSKWVPIYSRVFFPHRIWSTEFQNYSMIKYLGGMFNFLIKATIALLRFTQARI